MMKAFFSAAMGPLLVLAAVFFYLTIRGAIYSFGPKRVIAFFVLSIIACILVYLFLPLP